MKKLLTIREAGRALGFSPYMVRQALTSGKLETFDMGKRIWIRATSVQALAAELGIDLKDDDAEDAE